MTLLFAARTCKNYDLHVEVSVVRRKSPRYCSIGQIHLYAPMEHNQDIDKLRTLVMDYVICNLKTVFKDENSREMLKTPGADRSHFEVVAKT